MTESLVCPSCASPIAAAQHFCMHCNAPLTSFAATDPLSWIRTEGELVRRAFRQPSRMALAGIWLIFGPGTIAALIYTTRGLQQMWPAYSVGGWLSAVGFLAMMAGLVTLFGAILWRMTYQYLTVTSQRVEPSEPEDNPFDGEWNTEPNAE